LTKALVSFFSDNERDGIIASIMLIGFVYFMLEAVFKMLKWMAVKPLKEDGL
jgi:hypothetical protein